MVDDPRGAICKSIHELPKGWAWEWFTDVLSIEGGTQPPASEFVAAPRTGYVRLIQIRDFETDSHLTYIPDSSKWRKCHEADVLIARYGASLGRICSGLEGAYNVALAKVIPTNRVVLPYVYHLLRSDYFQRPLVAAGDRSAQAGFNKGDLSVIPLPIPPVDEQRAIAQILSSLDDKIELNRRMNKTLEAMVQAIFKSWFVDFDPVRAKAERHWPNLPKSITDLFPASFVDSEIGEIPKGWCVTAVRQLTCNIQYGLTQSASSEPVGPRFLRITDIQGGKVDWAAVPFCKVAPEEHERYRLKRGDIVVARTGASTGENVYLSKVPDAVFASYLVRFQFAESAMARFVGAYLRTKGYRDYVAGCVGGSAQPNASAQLLAGAQFVYPSRTIAEKFADLIAPFDGRIVENNELSWALASIRDAVLPKLISGKIRIKDAEKLASAVA